MTFLSDSESDDIFPDYALVSPSRSQDSQEYYNPDTYNSELRPSTEAGDAAIGLLKARLKGLPENHLHWFADIDALVLTESGYEPIPELANRVSQDLAVTELEKRLTDITRDIMLRSFCSTCFEYKAEEDKLYRACVQKHPVQHLECEECFRRDKSPHCPVCRGDRPPIPKEQSEELRYDFYHTGCQSCPLCTDPAVRTPQGLLEHVETECSVVVSRKLYVDERKLRLLLGNQRSRCLAELWASPATALTIQQIVDEKVRPWKEEVSKGKTEKEISNQLSRRVQQTLNTKIWSLNKELDSMRDPYRKQKDDIINLNDLHRKQAEIHQGERSRMESELEKFRRQAEMHQGERSEAESLRAENKMLEKHLEAHRHQIVSLRNEQCQSQHELESLEGQSRRESFAEPWGRYKRRREEVLYKRYPRGYKGESSGW
ncbi:hypothetical protein CYMTET_38967 [Cymbomonas tetramitiformis]|uniref:Uncharacterized protein n=1 Tax=Cymbomonas tetramitiformis TaxID=36881 RepID=A0AAE0F4E6_9CHLO|nr:hypothetical protein CYMTET_38967 [Cymbomonas tetramitiformis]